VPLPPRWLSLCVALPDASETTNIAVSFPAVVAALQRKLALEGAAYIDGTMDRGILERDYTQVHDPDQFWKNFSGPCYLRRHNSTTAAMVRHVTLSENGTQ
jgi:hypothetical protein